MLSKDLNSVLLARRQGEQDYDGVYSFIGGKMENTDESLVSGMKREKDEEIGSGCVIQVLPAETYNLLFRKKSGAAMVLPHIPAVHVSGDITLSDEYSDYVWVDIEKLDAFIPKIDNIPDLTRWAQQKLSSTPQQNLTRI